MSDNEDNIFDDDISVGSEDEDTKKSIMKKNNKITLQSDNDDSDYEDDVDEKDDDIVDDNEEVEDDADEDIEDIDLDEKQNDDDNSDVEQGSDDEDNDNTKSKKNTGKIGSNVSTMLPDDADIYGDGPVMNNEIFEDNESDEEPDENYLQKFETNIKENYVSEFHPETSIQNYEEIVALSKVVRDKNNIIVDPLHRTIPVLTKYERARVLGQRTKQLNSGSKPYITVPDNIIEGHLIAELELEQKRIPFIIRRPLPGGAGSEYWTLKDLEIITM